MRITSGADGKTSSIDTKLLRTDAELRDAIEAFLQQRRAVYASCLARLRALMLALESSEESRTLLDRLDLTCLERHFLDRLDLTCLERQPLIVPSLLRPCGRSLLPRVAALEFPCGAAIRVDGDGRLVDTLRLRRSG